MHALTHARSEAHVLADTWQMEEEGNHARHREQSVGSDGGREVRRCEEVRRDRGYR